MVSANKDIRDAAKQRGIHLYEIAFRLGCNDGNFSRKLRRELPVDLKQRIYEIINQIETDRAADAPEAATAELSGAHHSEE